MIDFRYHLVSIIAIFLALAVGLIVGATSLSGTTEAVLSHEEKLVTQENSTLRAKNSALASQVSNGQAFAQAGSGRLLSDLLTGEKVVLVVAPNTDSTMESGVSAALQQAGATVTGKVLLQQEFFDFSGQTESSLSQLAQQLAPQAGVKLPAPSSNPTIDGQQAAAAVLAASIVSKDGVGLPSGVSHTILSEFGADGFLQVSPTTPGAASLATATLAVLLTPAGAQNSNAQTTAVNEALVALAAELHSASLGTVMAGSLGAISPNSATSLEGGSGPASTVDNADTSSGEIMVAQALRLLLNGTAPAAYGVEPATVPSPAPTPASTPKVTTPGKKGKTK